MCAVHVKVNQPFCRDLRALFDQGFEEAMLETLGGSLTDEQVAVLESGEDAAPVETAKLVREAGRRAWAELAPRLISQGLRNYVRHNMGFEDSDLAGHCDAASELLDAWAKQYHPGNALVRSVKLPDLVTIEDIALGAVN